MTDFLRVQDRSSDEIVDIAGLAVDLAADFDGRRSRPLLAGQRIATWWDGPGFRNKVGFELGVTALGGATVDIPGAVGESEDLADIGAYLGNWFDAIVVRTPRLPDLESLAGATSSIVVNARTGHNHPCEILGDLVYLHAIGRDLRDELTVVFVGAATNLANSWLEAAAVLPIRLVQVCPPEFQVDLRRWRAWRPRPAGEVRVTDDLGAHLGEADVVYTDCWPPGLDAEATEGFAGLRVTAEVLDRCRPDVSFLPCPPVTRGQEVAADAMTHPTCRVVEAKRWLLHAQSALLVRALAGGG